MTLPPDPPLADRVEDDGYVFPDYDGACFAGVPETLLSLLSDEFDQPLPPGSLDDFATGPPGDISEVVVVLVDGLGYDQWRRDREHAPLLRTLEDRGTVSPLTSVFPSETAAAIPTFQQGVPPAQHGLLGWFQYIAEYDAILQTLPFTTLDDEPAGEVFEDADPGVLTDGAVIYPAAADAGVDAHLYQPAKFEADTPGATDHPYWNVADAVAEVRADVEAAAADDDAGPAYRYVYIPNVDAIAHRVGTDHPRYRAQVDMVTECVRRELVERLDPDAATETLLVVTADHGHVDTDPATNVDLGDTAAWEHVGEADRVVGSPRNVQFHLEGEVAPVREALDDEFGDDVRTFTREEYLDRGLFGPGTCETFERRSPDLVAVHRRKGMWWEGDEIDLVGMHGGLTREEMLVPLASARVDRLQG